MKQDTVFIYNWFVDNKCEEMTKLRAYALDSNNKNICIHISDFTPYIYIELPSNTEWTERKAQLLGNKLDDELGKHAPLKKCLIMKHKLYGAYINGNDERRLFPFLFCSFTNKIDITRYLIPRLKKSINVQGIGHVRLKVHESDADPILQLVSCRNIPSVGWVKFIGEELDAKESDTLCDKEYSVKWKGLYNADMDKVGKPLIMGFDIEVNSVNPSQMPKSKNPGDKVFQISCIFNREGETETEKYLMTLGEVDNKTLEDDSVRVLTFDTEAELLVGFSKLVQEKNPNIIAGYNILGFDIQYMIDRAKFNYCISEFDKLGFHKYNHSQEKTIKWSSSAYKSQEFSYLDAEGIIFVDLLPLIRRDYKLSNYRLGTVSEEILKDDTKNDLSIRRMFKLYKIGIQKQKDGTYNRKSKRSMALIGKYCLKDSELCIKLMQKMETWTGLSEFAKTVNTGIFSLYTQGQQIKVFSQIYKYCLKHNIVVEKDGYITKEGERYAGAHVFPPEPGMYKNVVSFDFASLYPTTMIAYNIDYSTLVPEGSDIPDSDCHVMEWVDCNSCPHDPKVIRVIELNKIIDKEKKYIKELMTERDKKCNKLVKQDFIDEIMKRRESLKPYEEERRTIKKKILKKPLCGKRKFKFYKNIKGVVPTILQNLLDARKATRIQIKDNNKEIKKLEDSEVVTEEMRAIINDLKILNGVLDKRQLAYKVSCNSAYGAYGVQRGYLPFMPGAMCIDGESQISFSYGFTRRLKNLIDTSQLWGYDNGQILSNGTGLKYNGKKEVLKITLIDGRTLKCTPDHKIMTTDGWIEAGKLLSKHSRDGDNFSTNSNYSKVITGLELPEDIIGEDEKWGFLGYTMSTPDNREKTLAFFRILGFILADGSISSYINKYNKNLISCKASIGTLLDAKIFAKDIKLITGFEPSITNCIRDEIKGNTFCVHIPKILIDDIMMIEGKSIVGKRTYTIPLFLYDEKCPLSVIREFLGGLFGGDGTSPSLSISHPSFSPIQLGLTTIEKFKDDMNNTMNKLVNLLARFDIKFWCATPRLARDRDNLRPKENPRWEYMITTNSNMSLLFAQKIGFRYCSDKNNKLSIAASYQRYSDNVKKQHINLVLKTSEMYDLNNKKIGIKNTLINARKEFYESEFPLHETISLCKSTDINNHRSRPHSLKDYRLLQKYFPTAREYTKMSGCEHWFSDNQCSEKVYSLKRDDLVSPCFYLDVVDIRYCGIEDVYDITDMTKQSFFANGIVVHNCTTYMGRTNIEIVAETIQKKYHGDLIYGDSVTEDTPILCRIDGKIYYRTISNLPHFGWKKYRSDKENAKPHKKLEVWTENGFTKIKNIIRHKTDKDIYRVLTHTGVVDVTEDHGLLNLDAEKVSPKEIKVGSDLLTSNLPTDNIDYNYTEIDKDIAFVMGLFYADGSCGSYNCLSGDKSSWAINKSNKKLLEKCRDILNNSKDSEYNIDTLQYKIIETMESSKTLKLIPVGKGIIKLVEQWRELFYDEEKYKKVPDEILWSPETVRQAFLDGYYSGDGDKDNYRFDNKGKIGSSGLYFLANSLGYKVSINTRNDKPQIYRLTCTKTKQRKVEHRVKKIYLLGKTTEYVYDLETENHHFSAGIGKLIVHNTDSNYVHFPHLSNPKEIWDFSVKVSKEVSQLFPDPIKLEFEDAIYAEYLILSKKRYMYRACDENGVVDKKVGKKGVLLARRDGSVFVRDLYEKIVGMVFDYKDRDEILYFILQEINKMFSKELDYKNFVITKAVGDTDGFSEKTKESQFVVPFKDEKGRVKGKIGTYTVPLLSNDPKEREEQLNKKKVLTAKEFYEKCLPAQVVLAEKIKRRGGRVENGARLEYLIIDGDSGHKGKQYEKIEDFDYFKRYSAVIKVDFFYYLNVLINPMDEILNVVFGKEDSKYKYKFQKDFTQKQFDFRYKVRNKLLNELKELFKPKLIFVG